MLEDDDNINLEYNKTTYLARARIPVPPTTIWIKKLLLCVKIFDFFNKLCLISSAAATRFVVGAHWVGHVYMPTVKTADECLIKWIYGASRYKNTSLVGFMLSVQHGVASWVDPEKLGSWLKIIECWAGVVCTRCPLSTNLIVHVLYWKEALRGES